MTLGRWAIFFVMMAVPAYAQVNTRAGILANLESHCLNQMLGSSETVNRMQSSGTSITAFCRCMSERVVAGISDFEMTNVNATATRIQQLYMSSETTTRCLVQR